MSRASTQQALRQLPTRWALGLLGLIVLYAVLQPVANDRLGWKLPSLARLLGEPEPKPKPTAKKESGAKEAQQQTQTDSSSQPERQATQEPDSKQASAAEAESVSPSRTAAKESRPPSKSSGPASATKQTEAPPKSSAAPNSSAAKPTSSSNATSDASGKAESSALLYGLLQDTGGKRYLSPAGLQYNPGSEEGHRLKHVERHLKDDPNRPGKHGVFDGDMAQVIRWIDDAYTRGKRGAKGVRKSEEDGRTVYEVPFDQPIGYIGGRDGNRANHPPAKRLRLVLDGVKVITAFPF